MQKLFHNKQEASVLVVGLILTLVVAIGAATASRFSLQEMRLGEHSRAWIQALHTAEAGVEVAMLEFNRDLISSGGNWSKWNTSGSVHSIDDMPMPSRPASRYAATYSVLADEGTKTITSVGTVTSARFNEPIVRTVEVVIKTRFPGWTPLDFGLLAKEALKIQGTPYCDAYDARLGPYNALSALAECTVGSMGTNAAAFTGGGAATVMGDAVITPEATAPAPFWSGNLFIESEFPEIPDQIAPNTHMTHGALAGNTTININGDTYIGTPSVSCNSLTITGHGVLTMYVDGKFDINTPQSLNLVPDAGKNITMKVYLNGDANIKGQLNTGGDPYNLQLYGTENCTRIDCQANNPKAMMILAPQAEIKLLGTSAIMGAIIGREIHAGGTFDFHYDISLKDRIGASSKPSRYTVESWVEL